MTAPLLVVLKLGLSAARRGDVASATEAFEASIAIVQASESSSASDAPTMHPHAVDVPTFAELVGYTPKHVRALADRGELACIGDGRGRRVLVAESLALLRRVAATPEAEGREYVQRRGRLRVVRAASGTGERP